MKHKLDYIKEEVENKRDVIIVHNQEALTQEFGWFKSTTSSNMVKLKK
jgi:hypothetical protein